jgi:hypothetical protein
MGEDIKSQMISRRRVSLLGLAAALAFAAPISVLTCPDAEAQTAGMERRQTRRQERRIGRTERRQERRTERTERRVMRRTARTERRAMRRTGTTGKGTTGQAPAKQ